LGVFEKRQPRVEGNQIEGEKGKKRRVRQHARGTGGHTDTIFIERRTLQLTGKGKELQRSAEKENRNEGQECQQVTLLCSSG